MILTDTHLEPIEKPAMWWRREEEEYDPDTDPDYVPPVFTVAEAELFLAQWKAYVLERPNSTFGPTSVAHWERVLAESRIREGVLA